MESRTSFDTEAHGDAAGAIRVLQLSDFHLLGGGTRTTMFGMDMEQSFAATAAEALASGPSPDLVLTTGDLVQEPEPEAYRRVRERLRVLPGPIYCLPGNHDDAAIMDAELVGGPIRRQPSIAAGPWRIICLDSTIPHEPQGRLSTDQLGLLETSLETHSQQFALIALHHHPVPSGSQWMDSMLLENREEFFQRLALHTQVRGVVFGHVHQEMDLDYQGLRILGTPSTCFQFKPRSASFALDAVPPGYRWLWLHPDGRIETKVGRTQRLPDGLDFSQRGY